MKKRECLKINTINELALQLKLPVDFLISISNNVDVNFISYEKQFIKKDGSKKTRRLFKASNTLNVVHKTINILLDCLQYPESIQGGIIGRSIQNNAIIHINKKFIAKFDIKDFFPSITNKMVYRAFIKQRCSPEVSRILTKLTTVCGFLPQGFKTSPKISNLILLPINESLTKFFKPLNINHSFWADDLTLSSNLPIIKYKNIITKVFKANGLSLNSAKTEFISNKSRQICTGLVINRKINVDKQTRQALKNELYFCKKLGLNAFLQKYKEGTSSEKYLKSLQGRINFLISVNPKYVNYLEMLNKIKPLKNHKKYAIIKTIKKDD